MRIVFAIALALALAACGTQAPTPLPGSPESVVGEALTMVAARDLDGLRGLACAGQEDIVREQLALAGIADATALLPGIDIEALTAAVRVDVSDVKAGSASVAGDVATVPVKGSAKVTFDAAAVRPIIKTALEQGGRPMTDDQLDALLKTLETYGQDVPVNQVVRLVREGGAWKVCQETFTTPPSP